MGFLVLRGGHRNDGARCFIKFYGGRTRDKRHKRRLDRLEIIRNFLTLKQGNRYSVREVVPPSLEAFKTRLDKAVSKLARYDSNQEVGPETSPGPF